MVNSTHPLTSALEKWIESNELSKDSLRTLDDARGVREFQGEISIQDQQHPFYIVVDESDLRLYVYIYSPYYVSQARAGAVAIVLNKINRQVPTARFAFDDNEASPIQCSWSICAKGLEIGQDQFDVMLRTVESFFLHFGKIVAAVALTDLPVETLWTDFIAQKDDQSADQSDEEDNENETGEGPAQL